MDLNEEDNYIGSICQECGEMSNHDEIDEDICPYCGKEHGHWEHKYN